MMIKVIDVELEGHTSDGDILLSSMSERPIILGNIDKQHLREIWEGNIRRNFLINQLKNAEGTISFCRNCTYYRYGVWTEEYIDDAAEEILARHFCE